MNALGLILLGTIARATAFAIVGALVYLAWRRSSPAAGALAAGSCLAVIALVSVLAVAPWQGFWTIDLARRNVASAGPAPADRIAAGGRPPGQTLPVLSLRLWLKRRRRSRVPNLIPN